MVKLNVRISFTLKNIIGGELITGDIIMISELVKSKP